MSRISIAALIVLVVAAMAVRAADQPADESGRFVVPNVADLTLETRRAVDRPGSIIVTRILKLKGAWQRSEETLSVPRRRNGARSARPHVIISRCDERRMIQLNDEARTYASTPIEDAAAHVQRLRQAAAANAPRPIAPGAEVKIIVDAVDTGERRQVGRLTARHVITTTTTEPGAGARTPASKGVVDGWYLDLPPINCWEWGARAALAFGSIAPDRVSYERRGMARSGVPIEEVARSTSDGRDVSTTTEFVRLSEAPLDTSLFVEPKGYQPALPSLNGGFDMTKPDTLTNRIESYWEGLASWVGYMLRN